MPKFLVQNELYRLIQRELPEDVYPDGSPEKFKSTSSVYAKAKTLETAYTNLSVIYKNFFPQTADEQIGDGEDKIFGYQLGSDVDLASRQQALVQQIQTRRRVTPADMKAIAYQIVPAQYQVEIVEWGCSSGGWVLDESELGISTYLNAFNGLKFLGNTDLCGKTAADWGLSDQDFADYQKQAYFYSVYIYGYTLSAAERIQLDSLLTKGEPARSAHEIVDGLDYDTQGIGGES